MDEKFEFLPDDFEFVGSAQDITKDVVAPATPGWKDALKRFTKNKGAVMGIVCIAIITLNQILELFSPTWYFLVLFKPFKILRLMLSIGLELMHTVVIYGLEHGKEHVFHYLLLLLLSLLMLL